MKLSITLLAVLYTSALITETIAKPEEDSEGSEEVPQYRFTFALLRKILNAVLNLTTGSSQAGQGDGHGQGIGQGLGQGFTGSGQALQMGHTNGFRSR